MATNINLSSVPDGVRITIIGRGQKIELTLSPSEADRIGEQLRQLASRQGAG